MLEGATESKTFPADAQNASSSAGGSGDAGDFECNICLDLAQDPIITLCGHLFCWPCLYRWLRLHSHSHECPVCKALIEEEKLIPLYGRGKKESDPRSKPVPGVEIPNRPAGQRPETAPPLPREANGFPNIGFNLMGGFLPAVSAGFGNFALLAAFGGFLPAMFSIQIQGFPTHGMPSGFTYGHFGGHQDADNRRAQGTRQEHEEEDQKLIFLLLIVFVLVIFCFMV